MNNFIRQSNKMLLIATITVGVGACVSQLNRANAQVVTGCPNNDGSIGTGPNCAVGAPPLAPIFDHIGCQSGGGNMTNYCCQYSYSYFRCTSKTGGVIILGMKGDLTSVTANGHCITTGDSGNSGVPNEKCSVGYAMSTDETAPTPERGGPMVG